MPASKSYLWTRFPPRAKMFRTKHSQSAYRILPFQSLLIASWFCVSLNLRYWMRKLCGGTSSCKDVVRYDFNYSGSRLHWHSWEWPRSVTVSEWLTLCHCNQQNFTTVFVNGLPSKLRAAGSWNSVPGCSNFQVFQVTSSDYLWLGVSIGFDCASNPTIWISPQIWIV